MDLKKVLFKSIAKKDGDIEILISNKENDDVGIFKSLLKLVIYTK